MALPPPDHPFWIKMANGGIAKIKTDHLGTQLLAKRLERSHDPIATKAAEIHAFFTKWERILSREIEQFSRI